MKYLLNVTEVYRVNTEEEVQQLIEDAKTSDRFILKKYSSQFKERKQKGEVIDAYYKVTLIKEFTNEKEPEFTCNVYYTEGEI